MSEKTLVKKLTKVMTEVKNIEKRGLNKFHNYKYATESDVADAVREILAREAVMMIPNMTSHSIREHTNNKGKIEYIATVVMEFTFHDGDSGETISFTGIGEGQDAGDKAVYKAMTGAQKVRFDESFYDSN
ncbi:ERF family protein [Bacillus sp. JCM 19041]|uniref:ERF family protein n=1 Tax=Bacillus sp. JCM 19041 TaxID=1460637 RepID=UPI0006D1884E